jgi:ABC-type sugar transport system ATPase subunit
MYLNIKIKEDFRTLKANQEYNFDFSEKGWHLIVGDNGCGKSTLLTLSGVLSVIT